MWQCVLTVPGSKALPDRRTTSTAPLSSCRAGPMPAILPSAMSMARPPWKCPSMRARSGTRRVTRGPESSPCGARPWPDGAPPGAPGSVSRPPGHPIGHRASSSAGGTGGRRVMRDAGAILLWGSGAWKGDRRQTVGALKAGERRWTHFVRMSLSAFVMCSRYSCPRWMMTMSRRPWKSSALEIRRGVIGDPFEKSSGCSMSAVTRGCLPGRRHSARAATDRCAGSSLPRVPSTPARHEAWSRPGAAPRIPAPVAPVPAAAPPRGSLALPPRGYELVHRSRIRFT